jgi:hypothetical protein
MVGDNVSKHSQLANEVMQYGHRIGNHTFHHLHGLRTSLNEYVENVKACDQVFEEKLGIGTSLFRPPYGMMSPRQAKEISKEKSIVMWSLLTGDYDKTVCPNRLLREVKPRTTPGKIIVFHDQEKTKGHLQKFLPDYLDFLSDQGFTVLIATIALFHKIHAWNRETLPNYFEVFVDVSLSEIKTRFPAKVYENLDIKSQIVGVDFEAEFPKNPDMRISGNLENFQTMSRELAAKINRREV